MSFDAIALAFQQKNIGHSAKFVLIALANSKNDGTGMCYPSLKTISEICEMDERTVALAVYRLEKAGLVTIKRAHGRNNNYDLNLQEYQETTHKNEGTCETGNDEPTTHKIGGTVPTKLWVQYPQNWGTNQEVTRKVPGRYNPPITPPTETDSKTAKPEAQPQDQQTDHKTATGHTAPDNRQPDQQRPTKTKTTPTKTATPTPAAQPVGPANAGRDRQDDIDMDFQRFWQAYPRKVAKGTAAKAWAKAKISPDIANLIVADITRRRIDDAQWQNPQYIPHPATYLNQQRWEDEIVTIAQAKRAKPKDIRDDYREITEYLLIGTGYKSAPVDERIVLDVPCDMGRTLDALPDWYPNGSGRQDLD